MGPRSVQNVEYSDVSLSKEFNFSVIIKTLSSLTHGLLSFGDVTSSLRLEVRRQNETESPTRFQLYYHYIRGYEEVS